MRVLVQMADGRTVHMLERRQDLITLTGRKLAALDTLRPVPALTRYHADGEFEPSRLMYLRPSSVAQIVQVLPAMDFPSREQLETAHAGVGA